MMLDCKLEYQRRRVSWLRRWLLTTSNASHQTHVQQSAQGYVWHTREHASDQKHCTAIAVTC